MNARVRRWGNSLAIRLNKKQLDSAGISEGDLVNVDVVKLKKGGNLDLESLPTFKDSDPKASARHDDYLYG
jgi:hypothetical protein